VRLLCGPVLRRLRRSVLACFVVGLGACGGDGLPTSGTNLTTGTDGSGASTGYAYADLGREELRALIEIKYGLEALDALRASGAPDSLVAVQRSQYLERALRLLGDSIQSATLELWLNDLELEDAFGERGVFQRLRGLLTFVNIVSTGATIILFVAVGWLVWLYVVPLLEHIPLEPTMHLASAGLMIGGFWFAPRVGHFIALLGCLGFMCSLAFTNAQHQEGLAPLYKRLRLDLESRISANALVVSVVWMIVSVAYGSALIGFFTILMLEMALGMAATPLCYFIGFGKKERVPRWTLGSLAILSVYVVAHLNDLELGRFSIFSTGALFVGAFVYFLGLLILSSKLYCDEKRQRYYWLQLLTVVSGVMALFLGTVGDVPHLKGVGGTFFGLYLIAKYIELPWKDKGWAWAALGFALMLYVFSLVVGQYPGLLLGGG